VSANPFRTSLPSLRALTRELRTVRVGMKPGPLFVHGINAWAYLNPTTENDWKLMAGPKSRAGEFIPGTGRFDAVACARRLLARARDSAVYRAKGASR
jgi:hypothetical protein